jgi:hypothetical protein
MAFLFLKVPRSDAKFNGCCVINMGAGEGGEGHIDTLNFYKAVVTTKA